MGLASRDDHHPRGGLSTARIGLRAAALPVAAVVLTAIFDLRLAVAAATIAAGALAWRLSRQQRRVGALEARILDQSGELATLRSLTDNAADLLVVYDLEMVCRYVSARSGEMLGLPPEALVGRAAVDLIHPEDVEGFSAAFRELVEQRHDPLVATQRYRRGDGTSVWTECTARVMRDESSGLPTGIVGSLRDIEGRRSAELALRNSESFLRGVVDSTPDCIKVLDHEGVVTFVSRNGLSLFSSDVQARPTGLPFTMLWPEALRNRAASAVAAAASGATARFTARIATPRHAGTTHLDVLVTPILGRSGDADRLLAITRDVTGVASAEAALVESEERYRLLAENSSDVVLLRRAGGAAATLYVSPSCRRVLGYEAEAFAERDLCDYVHPDDRDRVRALLEGLDLADGTVTDTHQVLRADGSYIWVEAAFQTSARSGGLTVAALRDVSERQRRTADLAAARDEAERARKAAEAANEAKSDFLAVMSHEIRTPLNSILGFTDLMLDAGDLGAESQRQAELIRAAGSALLTIVSDILDFSRIEAGAVELEAIAFDPAALARQSAEILGGYAGTKALDIAVEIAPDVPGLRIGDEARLRQILLNLLNNAVKFTKRGRVVLRVAAERPASASAALVGDVLRFEVEDTGIGIPEDKREHLFERFSQVDTSVARRFGGSGLGLAICKRLVVLMGGEIGVESRYGEGSTFWFKVPLPHAAAPVALPAPLAEPRPQNARILVVEDLDINRRLAVALLEAAGHQVRVAEDGSAAVALAMAEDFDLILMDVQMPVMDGLTATRLIRAAEGPRAQVPIVAMTANVYPDQIEVCRQAGMDDHIGKPLNRMHLYAAVDRWVAHSPHASEGGPNPVRAASEASPETFDPIIYGQLHAFLGASRLDGVLARFSASLVQQFEPGDETLDRARRWKADAHTVISVAGMLGFTELARLCRSLEPLVPGQDAFGDRLAAIRSARDAALPHLVELRRDLSRGKTSSAA